MHGTLHIQIKLGSVFLNVLNIINQKYTVLNAQYKMELQSIIREARQAPGGRELQQRA